MGKHNRESENSGSSSSLDNLLGMARQIKSLIPHRHVDFNASAGGSQIKIDYLDETDIAILTGLLTGTADAPLKYYFEMLDVYDEHGNWNATGIPNSVLTAKYNRDASVADNSARVRGKVSGESYIQIPLHPLKCLDAISNAYDKELSLFGKNKRVKDFCISLMQ